MSKRWRIFAVVLMLTLGLSLIVTAWLLPNGVLSQLLLATLGSALAGSAIASILSLLEAFDFIELHHRAVAEYDSDQFRSHAADIARFKIGIWHHYYITVIDGEPTWQYGLIDFRTCLAPRLLKTRTSYVDKYGKAKVYECDGVLLHTRLVLTISLVDDDEPCDVCVFPFMTKNGLQYRCGVGMRETWDGEHAVCPEILCEQRITSQSTSGTIAEPADTKLLSDTWRENVDATMRFLVVGKGGISNPLRRK